MLDPYSLVDGVASPTISLATFSADSPAIGEFVSNDLQLLELVERTQY